MSTDLPTEWNFKDRYRIRRLESFDGNEEQRRLLVEHLGTAPPLEPLLSPEEWASYQELRKSARSSHELCLGAYAGETLVAFTHGWLHDGGSFHMARSLVHPDHRGQGLYSELMRATIEHTRAAGFQLVTSSHRASNNPILIAKLKAGFVISGLRIDDGQGIQVELTYFHNPARRELMDARCGKSRPTGRIRDLFF